MNISQMLNLPREQRSKLLAALPLTRCYVFGCLELSSIHFTRRTIVRNGGTWRELYAPPGLAVTATFRSYSGMMQATRALAHWLNESIRKAHTDIYGFRAGHEPEVEWSLLYNDDFGNGGPSVPALSFEIVNAIQPISTRHRAHPIRGKQ